MNLTLRTSFTLLFIVIIIFPSAAQWEKHPILGSDFLDSAEPQWADINSDGMIDIVGYDQQVGALFYRRNTGDDFASPIAISTNIKLENGNFILVDWDNDGDTDIVCELEQSVLKDHFIELFINQGEGDFISKEIYTELDDANLTMHSVVDIDGNGDLDILFTAFNASYIYYNNNDNFSFEGTQLTGRAQHVADLKFDGDPEILFVNQDADILIYNIVDKQFELTTTINSNYPSEFADPLPILKDLSIVDLDNDGDLDITRITLDATLELVIDVGNIKYGNNIFFQHIQNDNGTFLTTELFRSATKGPISSSLVNTKSTQSYAWAFYDLNYKELRFINEKFELDYVTQDKMPADLEANTISAIDIFNEDTEQLYTSIFEGGFYQIQNSTFSDNPDSVYEWNTCANCVSIQDYEDIDFADMNGNGNNDIIISSLVNDNQIIWLENFRIACHFDEQNVIVDDFFDAANAESISCALGDLNNDGDIDAVIKIDSDEAKIYYAINAGDGTFGQPMFLDTYAFANDLYVEDLNNDGFSEIILHTGMFSTITEDPATFSVSILNNTTGLLTATLNKFETSTSTGQLEFADMDNDGDTDMVVYNDSPWNEVVDIYYNTDGTMSLEHSFGEFVDMIGIDVFDTNGDNFPEVLGFQDNENGNNETTVYAFINNGVIVNFSNPILTLEDINRELIQGIKQPDGNVGYVGSSGGFSSGQLLYYNGNSIPDTLDTFLPKQIKLADLNNDGFDEIIYANNRGALSFFTLGETDCNPIINNVEENIYELTLTKVFPNPSMEMINIESSIEGICSIMDAHGKLIYVNNKIPQQLSIADYPTGIYYLTIQNAKNRTINKIVKTK